MAGVMKRLRVLVLVHPELVPPDSLKGHTEQEINEWKTEYDVASTLREAGHEVRSASTRASRFLMKSSPEMTSPRATDARASST